MAFATPPPPASTSPQPRRSPDGELPLDLRDGRLAWLEAEESDELRRGGSGRLLGIACALLAVLALGAAGVWYVHSRREAAAMVATGEIIRAPAGPYKVRPPDAGGDVAAGTGDTSFLVAQGKTRSVQVAGDTAGDPGEAVAAPTGANAGAAPLTGVGVQLGAFNSPAEAEAAWSPLSARFPVLSGLPHRVVEQRADVGSVFALQAVTQDAHGGQALCQALKAGALSCMVR